MVKDRLAALRAAEGFSLSDSADGNANSSEDDPLITKEHWTNIESFLAKCTRTNKALEDLESYVNSIRDMHGKILSCPDADKELTQKLSYTVAQFTTLTRAIRKEIDELTQEAEMQPLSAPKTHAQSADTRIKKMQVMTLQRRLYQSVSRFNTEEADYKERHIAAISHYLKIQGHDVPDDDVMKAVEDGQIDDLTKGLVLATADKKALYAEVRMRRDELLRLEASVRQLAEIFHDLNILVLSQGEMMDNIESNIQATVDFAERAKKQVEGARNLQKKARKMKILICIVLVVLAILLFFIIQGLVCHFTPLC